MVAQVRHGTHSGCVNVLRGGGLNGWRDNNPLRAAIIDADLQNSEGFLKEKKGMCVTRDVVPNYATGDSDIPPVSPPYI